MPIDEKYAKEVVRREMQAIRREQRLRFLAGVAIGILLTLLVLGILGKI